MWSWGKPRSVRKLSNKDLPVSPLGPHRTSQDSALSLDVTDPLCWRPPERPVFSTLVQRERREGFQSPSRRTPKGQVSRVSIRVPFLTCFLQLRENIKYSFLQFLKSLPSRADRLEQLQPAPGGLWEPTVGTLIYILMPGNILRGKDEHSLVLVMNRTRKEKKEKKGRKVVEKL